MVSGSAEWSIPSSITACVHGTTARTHTERSFHGGLIEATTHNKHEHLLVSVGINSLLLTQTHEMCACKKSYTSQTLNTYSRISRYLLRHECVLPPNKTVACKHILRHSGMCSFVLVEKLSVVILNVRRMDLDCSRKSVEKNIKEQELHLRPCRLQLCAGFGVWCRPGCTWIPCRRWWGLAGKTVWERINKQWKPQQAGRPNTAWPCQCFLNSIEPICQGYERLTVEGHERRNIPYVKCDGDWMILSKAILY